MKFENGKGYCEYCKLSNPFSAYSTGVTCLKKSNFVNHEETFAHVSAEKEFHSKKIQARIKFSVKQPTDSTNLSENVPLNFKNLRRAITFLVVENIALIKSEFLLSMIEKCGVSLSQSYRDKHAARDLVECLASSLEDNLISKLSGHKFIGIQIDESTDVGKESILISYVSYFFEGKSRVDYLKSFRLDEKNAQHIHNTLSAYLKTKGIYPKIYAQMGAAVMSSHKNGVCGLLKKELKNMVFLYCVAHRINLTTSDIVDRFSEVKSLQSFIYDLVKFFINSPKKIKLLDDFQEENSW